MRCCIVLLLIMLMMPGTITAAVHTEKSPTRSILNKLTEIDRRIENLNSLLESYSVEKSLFQRQIEQLDTELLEQEQLLEAGKRSLIAAYKVLQDILIKNRKHNTLIHRMLTDKKERGSRAILPKIIEKQATKIREQENSMARIKKTAELVRKEKGYLSKVLEKHEDYLQELRSEREEHRKLLSSIQDNRDDYETLMLEYGNARTLLDNYMKKLLSGGMKGAAASKWKKRGLPNPVTSGEIIRGFGTVKHPRFRTEIFNSGINIRAQADSPVKAVHGGIVVYAGWFRGYGNLVILDHGNRYFTLYGHLSKINAILDKRVESGETIGLVGDTNSYLGTNLYFETRYKNTPFNPLPWMAAK